MSKSSAPRRKVWLGLIGFTVVLVLYGTVQKIRLYAAEPVGQKDCPPLLGRASVDETKPTTLVMTQPAPSLDLAQTGGVLNDASCLDETPVYGVIDIKSEEDVRRALRFAEAKNLTVSVAGVKHSMGGQAFAKNALILNMMKFNTIALNAQQKTVTVQAGATWHDIQNQIHPRFAIKAMQSTDIFSVGGSISVNAHGMDHQAGSVGGSIRSLRVMMADGTIKTISRTQDPELFRHVVGGYGLFGVILDAELDVVDNVAYETGHQLISYDQFPDLFASEIAPDERYGLMYGHLSTAPSSLLREMIFYTYRTADDQTGEIAPIGEVSMVPLRRFVLNLSKRGALAREVKWWSEKVVEPKLNSCTVISRNDAQASGEACLVSRNDPMHDSVPYLRNTLPNDTDILHEYFVPRDQFVPFIDGLRTIFTEHNANLLNASVRVAHKEDTALSYAQGDVFSIVLYINQTTDERGNDRMRELTRALIDLSTAHGGRFFLPYQLHYTSQQLRDAYPEIDTFFATKLQYDPAKRFSNTWYEKYALAQDA